MFRRNPMGLLLTCLVVACAAGCSGTSEADRPENTGETGGAPAAEGNATGGTQAPGGGQAGGTGGAASSGDAGSGDAFGEEGGTPVDGGKPTGEDGGPAADSGKPAGDGGIQPGDPKAVPFTYLVIPDTQFMANGAQSGSPEMFKRHIDWIKNNVTKLNVKFVSHLGDVVDLADDPKQWTAAKDAMAGLEDVVPFSVAYGNHEVFVSGWTLDTRPGQPVLENFRAHFPVSRFAKFPWFGGSYPDGKMDHNYELFSAGGMDFIVLHLGWNPSAEARAWGSKVLADHKDRRAIVVTHEYLQQQVNAIGQGIWNDVIKNNDNVFLLVCGHDNTRENMVVTKNAFGRSVPQILTDYQKDNPQVGFLRYYTFDVAKNEIRAFTYSTEKNQYETDANSQFTISYRMQ